MQQQINLFQPVFRKQQKVFSAATLAQIAAAVVVLLLLLLGHARWTLAGMEASASNMQQQYEHLQQQIRTLEGLQAAPDSEGLDNEIGQLRTYLDASRELLSRPDHATTKIQHGFYNRFRLLTEPDLPDLRLNGVTMDNNAHIEIRGSTQNARQVPFYLQQLSRQSGLSNTPFEAVKLTRKNIRQTQIDFVLRNFHEAVSWD